MNKEKLNNIFEQFGSKKVLIIGDVMIDSYLWGNVKRISPEAPIPIVSILKREYRLGGAANVALNLKSLGCEPVICSVIGNDETGKLFLDLLAQNEMKDSCILTSEKRKTTRKSRIISRNQHLLRVDDESEELLDKGTEINLISLITSFLEKTKPDAIIFEDYDKGVVTKAVIEETVKCANKVEVPVFVDPKRQNFDSFKNVTLFKPNFKELVQGLNLLIQKTDTESVISAAENLRSELSSEYVMVTLSDEGVILSSKEESKHIKAEKRDISDVSGAGDTVISVVCACYISGMTMLEAAMVANIAGGMVCEKPGVVPVEKAELQKECLLLLSE